MAFRWYFAPDAADIEQCRGFECQCASIETFKTEVHAIRAGKRWMKECHRTGTVTAVPAKASGPAYILDILKKGGEYTWICRFC